jgi:hypothetical protein
MRPLIGVGCLIAYRLFMIMGMVILLEDLSDMEFSLAGKIFVLLVTIFASWHHPNKLDKI